MSTLPSRDENAATVNVGSDSYPYTIVKRTARTLVLRADDYRRVDEGGLYVEEQDYEFTTNPNGKVVRAYLRSNGRYVVDGCCGVIVGLRAAYRDPSF